MRQDISYVVIDTLNYELSTYALTRSLEQFPLENILILEDDSVKCKMTLTSPFCPVAGEMPIWVKEAIEAAEGVNTVNVEMTFTPTFTPEYASELAQMDLGFFSAPEPDYDNWNPR